MSLYNPVIHPDAGRMPKYEGLGGVSLRDYFAGKALAGGLADPNVRIATPKDLDDVAKACWAIADAMLKNRGS